MNPVRLGRERLRGLRRLIRGVPPAPHWVQVEVNNTCNLNCVMCPRDMLRRQPHHMSLEQFRDIADKCAAAHVERLRLFFLGEPLLHRDLPELIRYAKSVGIGSVEINTNAVLLDDSHARALLDSGVDEVVFSLDGADRVTYESIRLGGQYEQVVANIEAFSRLARERPQRPRLAIQTIVMRQTQDQIAGFVERWSGAVDLVRVQAVREYGSVEGVSLTPWEPGDERRPCPALWSYLVILSDFTIAPCCVDINGDLSLGDIRQTDIATVWSSSSRLRRLRRDHCAMQMSRYELCRGCEFTNATLVKRKAAMSLEAGSAL